MPLVDTNVLLDLITDDPIWTDWSIRQLQRLSLQGRLIVNPVVPARPCFLAGKAFAKYRRGAAPGPASSATSSSAPIGVVEGIALLTRDNRRYRSDSRCSR